MMRENKNIPREMINDIISRMPDYCNLIVHVIVDGKHVEVISNISDDDEITRILKGSIEKMEE